jgi:tetratricopeptide (TPR) repeat protein
MKKNSLIIFVLLVMAFVMPTSSDLLAQTKSKNAKTSKAKMKSKKKSTSTTAGARAPIAKISSSGDDLSRALGLAKNGDYESASNLLFQLSLSPRYVNERMQIRYLLGLMLYEMKLYQTSAFQFISVIKDGSNKYVSKSLEKLSLAADKLGDDTLLNYAISRTKAESFPAVHKDMLFYRIGEFQMRNEQFKDAIRSFEQVPDSSPLYSNALYMKGLSYAELGQASEAVNIFELLTESRSNAAPNDPARVSGIIGKARALYQKKDWEGAIETYRQVPRDSEAWHDTLFEGSWAMLRSGKFRSAISNFQSLHSPYYEDAYIPESLLLRSIVYLYICQYDEMDKVLDLFTKLYRPVYKQVNEYLNKVKDPVKYFTDVVYTLQMAEKEGFNPQKVKLPVPYLVTRKATKEGDFQRSFKYIKKLIAEKKTISRLSSGWRTSGIGKYASQTIDRRLQKARAKAGRQVRVHMISVKGELVDLFEQEGFIRYEKINGKKELIKKRMAGKEETKAPVVNDDQDRDYYIKNGYQYWTFRGEYWLDELGNYHYVGTQSCN